MTISPNSRTTAVSPLQVDEAAHALVDARRSGRQIAALPVSCRPADIASALAIQMRVCDLMGETCAAWKCGLPNGEMIVAAPIHAGTLQQHSPVAMRSVDGLVRVEPELAFILGHDLPARPQPYPREEMRAAIVDTRLALELIGSRYVDHCSVSFLELLADGLVNQGLYLGPTVPQALARELGSFTLTVRNDDGVFKQHQGVHPAGDPLLAYYWLVEFLHRRGVDLARGTAIITGSYAGVIELLIGLPFTIEYGELGRLSVRFDELI